MIDANSKMIHAADGRQMVWIECKRHKVTTFNLRFRHKCLPLDEPL